MELKLEAPEAVPEIDTNTALDMVKTQVPASSQEVAKRDSKVVEFIDNLTTLPPDSPEFKGKLGELFTVGDEAVKSTTTISSRMLDRPMQQGSENSPQLKVAGTLQELREQITELDPERADLKGVKKLFKWLPGSKNVERYFNRYASAKSHLEAITQSLAQGQDELRKDNAEIAVYSKQMWEGLGNLKEYNELLGQLDEAITAKIAEAKQAGNMELAKALENDALFATRQRRTDIQTQIAVSVQGYLALDLVQKNNVELIRGVDRAQTTTMSAMQTAIIVAQALGVQERVLTQITALNSATGQFIESTSNRLKTQGAEIQKQASSSMIEVEKLQIAFQNVFEAMDSVDNFRVQANENLAQTITALDAQVEKARPYLERAKRESE